MPVIKIQPRSRLQFSNLALVADQTATQITFWDIPSWPNTSPAIMPQTDDIVYQWDQIDNIRLVANSFYGDPSLWWVIAERNQIFDLPTGIVTGQMIIIPSRRYVLNVLFAKKG